jgi:vancomycin resistance protein YoaR
VSSKGALALSIVLVLGLAGLFFHLASLQKKTEIANFSTSVKGRTPEQLHNLKIAVERLSGTPVRPGEVFSLNKSLGERTQVRGYREAPTLWNGTVVDTPGGGLCQLTSTVYNVALLANLPIVERHPHLHTIASVGPGRDATLLSDRLDLRFRNNRPFPITIMGSVEDERLIVRLYGREKSADLVDIRVERLGGTAPPRLPQAALDGASPGVVSREGSPGVAVRTWRIVRKEGGGETREIISLDRYAPEPAVGH